jgi:hypothetical protein
MTIWVHGPADVGALSTLKPASLKELSVQDRLIWLCETAVAVRPLGAIGIDSGVVAVATPERLSPAVLKAATR